MTVAVEIFFDLSSPWTRIAFHNVRQWAAGKDVDVVWRPFLVGGVFNAVNDSVYAGRQNPDNPKFRLTYVWLKEWAKLAEVAMTFPSPHHPVKSVNAMRFCCVLEQDQPALVRFAEAAFDAYFADQQDIDDAAVLIAIAHTAGLDAERLADQAQTPEIKKRLRDNTQEAIDRGAFGSPTFFIEKKFMYFGNDQLPLVQQRVEQCR
jgi:2-hydroxychromene-2-carboxylate isomerase